jgi:hypothetical protein
LASTTTQVDVSQVISGFATLRALIFVGFQFKQTRKQTRLMQGRSWIARSIYDFSVWILSIQGWLLVGFIYKKCNIYIMELIGNVVWILGGFIPALITMEVAWRLGSRLTKKSANDRRQKEKMITVSAR